VKVFDDLFDAEIHDHTEPLRQSPYWNADIAPVPRSKRTWGTRDMAVLWIGMSACVPTYMLASSLIAEGMNWWQAILTIFLGNCIVLIPMILNAHAGTKYGIPFPVFARASFGVKGANIPAILRAIVACGWFGIQTWIGGWAIYKLLTVYFTTWDMMPQLGFLGINFPQLVCFLFFWLINMYIIYRGMESIRHIEDFLLELGKGFMFVGSQQRITLGNEHYYVDMVFYNKILKAYVLIDLKIRKLKHTDVGQMNTYLNYYKAEINEETDNPPIGIILCTEKHEIEAQYALGGLENKVFASRYTYYIPDKDVLINEVQKALDENKED